ncbi:QWRF motif-containing protein 7-like [Papaver somniferum]|uniref:QWRF motif-containing protein 7-like n=1 Tax=Papaver somniferum TaxID=3469 RepID=UPI000E704723|nr:QWRF motif-containing protein 7-like [Papaver somniferum]XP_026433374.1 QWRF motif-containing protein 7-like [Papaver somniferum]
MENSSSRSRSCRYPASVIKRSPSPNLFLNRNDDRVSVPPNLPPLTPNNTTNKINYKNRNSVAADKAIEMAKIRRAKSVSKNCPSAWALSPGRSSPSSSTALAVLLKSPNNISEPANRYRKKMVTKSSSCGSDTDGGGRRGSTGGVFRYFRSKSKVSCAKEEGSHRLRIFHTRLVQWRLVNACAEMLMDRRNSIAVMKLFNVWSRIYQMRKLMVEKRIQVEKLRKEVKLLQIINPQLNLLNKWSKIEKKNSEALTTLAGNLSSLSIRVPLINGAKVDMVSFYKTMRTTVNLMNNIEETVERSFLEVKETSLLLDQLIDAIRQETKSLEELRNTLAIVSSLEAQEESLRVHLIQAANKRILVS